jgi:hypothetical protein
MEFLLPRCEKGDGYWGRRSTGQPAGRPVVHTFAAGEVGKMNLAMSNALAVVRWHGFKSLQDSDTQEKIVWLVVGLALGVVVMWVIARRRRRFF